MRFGITMFLTDQSIGPAELAVETEARGFESLYIPEHTHIPVSRSTSVPTGDGELKPEYSRTLDPFVALTAAAGATERLTVGTGICLVAQHDPIVLAKSVATLDLISGGRFTFGVGFGWNREELADHGVAFADRREVVRERMLAMQALWTNDVASFAGEHVRFEASWQWPKPLQQPRPPVLVGGSSGPKLFRHVAEWADGWIPVGGGGLTEAIPRLRDEWAGRDRDPADLQIVPFGSVPTPGKLEHFHDIGVTEVVFRLPSGPRQEVMPVLDEYAGLLPK
jgi:probable F420-dependent oxidoreductase